MSPLQIVIPMAGRGSRFAPDEQTKLVAEMRQFLGTLPPSLDLAWTLDEDFLHHFESTRIFLMRDALARLGFNAECKYDVLDFGYLHGLVPEFLHRSLPLARFTVLDQPGSPIFSDPAYRAIIAERSYLRLLPHRIEDCDKVEGSFDLIILGEIIEHLDPTIVAAVLSTLRGKIKQNGALLITTPNGAGLYNTALTLFGQDAQSPPIPDCTMGFPHIHLWSAPMLVRTLEYAGWHAKDVLFYHGREGEAFARSSRNWHSLKHQAFMKLVQTLTRFRPCWRGFFVMSAQPAQTV